MVTPKAAVQKLFPTKWLKLMLVIAVAILAIGIVFGTGLLSSGNSGTSAATEALNTESQPNPIQPSTMTEDVSPQSETVQMPVPSQPAVAQESKLAQLSTTFPQPEELVEMDLQMLWPIPWAWGEYEVNEQWQTGKSGVAANVVDWALIPIWAAAVNDPRPHRYWSEHSVAVAKQIGERLVYFDGVAQESKAREIHSVLVDPDQAYGVETNPSGIGDKKFFVFSAVVTITFEGANGEESVRFWTKSGTPVFLSDPELQLLN